MENESVYEPGLVSIGLPVYNGGETLQRALDSLLNQTYRNTEVIISDNASTDGTQALCEGYALRDPRIRYIRQAKNISQAPNMELVIHKARGEYFMFGADDDFWHPTFIEKTKAVLDTHSAYGVAMSSISRRYDDGGEKDTVSYTDGLDLTHKSFPEVFNLMTTKRPIHLFFYGLMRTSLIQQLIRLPFPKSKAADRVFMIEMSLVTHFYPLSEILFEKTVSRQQVAERVKYKNDRIGRAFTDPKAHSRYVYAVVRRLVLSSSIPFLRKIAIYPYYLSVFLWNNRVFLREWFPSTFGLVLKVKAALRGIGYY